jgi:NADPH:quinone reductase-like Zn-dependent oxidoreductase
VKPEGLVELTLLRVPTPVPTGDEVLVRVDAAPINPSDLGLLLAGADVAAATTRGSGEDTVVTLPLPPEGMRAMAARVGQSMPVGNEGAGVVVDAGDSPAARALLGKTVALLGGAMYAEYRCMPASACLVLPEGASAEQGAACFVNPLTALGMVETMRLEGHHALVHTAAASNLGQMLQKLCLADGVPLVNIVRKPEQAALLRSIGATHVCNSSEPSFMDDLIAAVGETNATMAFDAIGGGKLAGQILTAMEAVASRKAGSYSRYGSNVHKQVYIYGMLDRGPTILNRSFGFAWSVGGWLLTPFLMKLGPEGGQRLRERIVRELTTTFASHYAQRVSLLGALQLDALRAYGTPSTAGKYLMTPSAS